MNRFFARLKIGFKVLMCRIRGKKPRFLRCFVCGRETVVYCSESTFLRTEIKCTCGSCLSMPVASQTYKIFQSSAKEECSLIAKKIVTIEADARKREEIIREIDLFDKDWSIYCDKNMPRRIQRLKEQTDRLYKKLQVANSKSILGAVHSAAASNAMVANTEEGVIGFLVSLVGAAELERATSFECAQMENADLLNQRILLNETCIDHFYNICDEFDGMGYEEAKNKRLASRCGDDAKSFSALSHAEFQDLEKMKDYLNSKKSALNYLPQMVTDDVVCMHNFLMTLGGCLGVAILITFVTAICLLPTMMAEHKKPSWRDLEKSAQELFDRTRKNSSMIADEIGKENDLERLSILAKTNSYAAYRYGLELLRKSEGDNDKIACGMSFVQKSADEGWVPAMIALGDAYAKGLSLFGCAKDERTGFTWYKRAIDKDENSPTAQRSVGIMLYRGIGIEKNVSLGVDHLTTAAHQGDNVAQLLCGIIGISSEIASPRCRLNWIACAAIQENPHAAYLFGALLAEGKHVRKDRARAEYWISQAQVYAMKAKGRYVRGITIPISVTRKGSLLSISIED